MKICVGDLIKVNMGKMHPVEKSFYFMEAIGGKEYYGIVVELISYPYTKKKNKYYKIMLLNGHTIHGRTIPVLLKEIIRIN